METNFNFNSQMCTSREQSERLVALGLKKETADMHWELQPYYNDEGFDCGLKWSCNIGTFTEEDADIAFYDYIPAWSLHRLIEMMPYCVEMYNKDWCLQVSKGYVRYASIGREKSYIGFIQKPNTFDAIISCIEWLIKEGYFNKEYLEE